MSNQWFRMYTDFLNDPKIISLAFEDQRHFIGLLALKSDGTLDQQCEENLLNRIIAQRLWIDYSIILDVKKRLLNARLISESWQPLAWEKRQFVSDSSAARTRTYRDRLKRHSDVTVTAPDTDTDTDTEKPSNTDVLLVASHADDPQKKPDCPHQEIIALYHQILPACHRIVDWTPARAKVLKARWDENKKRQSLEYWKALFEYIARCPFLVGKAGNKPFLASLDWICKAENFAKIREGRYEEGACR